MLVVFSSCDSSKKEYYENGKIKKKFFIKENKLEGIYKEYYESGFLKELHFYKKGEKIDSSLFYVNSSENYVKMIKYYLPKLKDTAFVKNYDKNKLLSEGLEFNNNRVKKWKIYNEGIESVFQYLIINNEEYLNQSWFFNQNLDTIYNRGTFIEIKYKDTIRLGEDNPIDFFLKKPLFSEKSKAKLFIDLNPKSKVAKDFSNIQDVDLIEVNHTPVNKKYIGLSLVFKNKGKHTFRGYVLEYIEGDKKNIGSVFKKEHKKYFEFSFIVE